MKDIDEIVDFVWENYTALHKARVKEDYTKLFTRHPEILEVARNDGKIKAVACYYRLNRKQFERLKQNKLDILNPVVVRKLLRSGGRNIHFFLLVGTGAFRHIYKHLKIIIKRERAHTVSWYRSDMKKLEIFNIRRK